MSSLLTLNKERISLSRPTPAVMVPEGTTMILEEAVEVTIVHELGGDYTVRGLDGRMYRIDGDHGDALGKASREQVAQEQLDALEGKLTEEIVWEQLKTCYDPEIPVDIVELGLIYKMTIVPLEDNINRIEIDMTLTAPGCGMGQVIADDVKRKVEKLSAVSETVVELVFDPPWNPGLMSEAARLMTGMM